MSSTRGSYHVTRSITKDNGHSLLVLGALSLLRRTIHKKVTYVWHCDFPLIAHVFWELHCSLICCTSIHIYFYFFKLCSRQFMIEWGFIKLYHTYLSQLTYSLPLVSFHPMIPISFNFYLILLFVSLFVYTICISTIPFEFNFNCVGRSHVPMLVTLAHVILINPCPASSFFLTLTPLPD